MQMEMLGSMSEFKFPRTYSVTTSDQQEIFLFILFLMSFSSKTC